MLQLYEMIDENEEVNQMVSSSVERNFLERLEKCMKLIEQYDVKYDEIGVFGSYARLEHTATSDIDLCIVTNERPERKVSGALREEAEELRVDIIFVTPTYLEADDSVFSQQIKKDYRRIR